MVNLEKFLNECSLIESKKFTKNVFSFCGENKNVKLTGRCKGTALEAKLVSKNGTILYNISEDCLKEEFLVSRVKDMTKMLEQAALVEMNDTEDLERDSDEKDIILDDAEELINEENEADNASLEFNEINSLSQLKDELISIANRSSNLINMFNEDDIVNRSMIIGLISGIYEVAQDTSELEEDLIEIEEDSEKIKESVSVPTKTDYIDLAGKGISQACFALNRTKNFKNLVEILKDIKSELATSK